MKKIYSILAASAISTGCLLSTQALAKTYPIYEGNQLYSLKISSVQPAPDGKKGLYVVNFDLLGWQGESMATHTYRIYCPTKTVRNISNGIIRPARTAAQEDAQVWSGDYTLRYVVKTIC